VSSELTTETRQPLAIRIPPRLPTRVADEKISLRDSLWAVLAPESLAYATIAGVSPVIGLYAAPAALVLYAAFGSSRHRVTGPIAATAALSAAAMADGATDDASFSFTVVLAIVTGVLVVLAGLLRLGFMANFISEPVLKGFIIGLALTIIVGQLPKLFGIEGGEGNLFEKLPDWLANLDETHLPPWSSD
jgi:sulfate permease, SulP family